MRCGQSLQWLHLTPDDACFLIGVAIGVRVRVAVAVGAGVGVRDMVRVGLGSELGIRVGLEVEFLVGVGGTCPHTHASARARMHTTHTCKAVGCTLESKFGDAHPHLHELRRRLSGRGNGGSLGG